MAIPKTVPFNLPTIPYVTPQRAFPNQVGKTDTERQQAINQALNFIYQIDPRVPLGQIYNVWFVDSTSGTDNLAVGTDLTNRPEITVPQGYADRLVVASAAVTIAPVGADIIIDILRSIDNATWQSIFPAGNQQKLVIKDGSFHGRQLGFVSDPFWLYDGDLLRYDLIQVGSGTPGRRLSISVMGTVLESNL